MFKLNSRIPLDSISSWLIACGDMFYKHFKKSESMREFFHNRFVKTF
jgi:hypothetical protein